MWSAASRCHTDRVKISKLLSTAAIIALSIGATVGLSACAAPNTPVIAPVTKDVGQLQGATVDLVVGQVLNINTNDLAVDSYTGKVDDPSVVKFEAGRVEGGTTYNPGFTALAEGSTQVVMTNANGGIQPLTFTIEVSAK